MEDLTSTWLANCSPYISKWVYDIGNRELTLECVNNPNEMKPTKRIVLSGILSYSEQTIDDEIGDNCLDGVIGINWISKGTLCVHTDKKEIIVSMSNAPVVENIA